MKFRVWTNILISIIMLIISGYLLADSSALSLDLLSNPNLNVAIELIRFFWGVVGVIYFLYYLYHSICFLHPLTINGMSSSVHPSYKRKIQKGKRPRERHLRNRSYKHKMKQSKKNNQ